MSLSTSLHTPRHLHTPRCILSIAGLLALLLTVVACRHSVSQDKYGEMERLRNEAKDAAMREDFGKSDSLGKELYKLALAYDNEVFQAYGLMSQSYYNYVTGESDKRMKTAQKALDIALQTDNDTLISRVYNVLGCYATLHQYDFAMAVHYFSEAKKHAQAIGARDFVMAADCNISEIYHSIGDTLGLAYDREIYDFAMETGQYNFMLPAAQHMAEHYMSRPATSHLALPYITTIDSTKSPYLYHKLMGDYYRVTGDEKGAVRNYEKSADASNGSAGVFISYADLLYANGSYEKSLSMLDKARESLSGESAYNTSRTRMLKLYADNYRQLQRHKEALDYLDRYIALRDSINEYRNTEQVNRFRIRYDLGKKELEVTRARADLRIRNIILGSVLLLSLIVITLVVIYYKKRNRLLQVIVDRQKSLIHLRNDAASAGNNVTYPAVPPTDSSHVDDGTQEDYTGDLTPRIPTSDDSKEARRGGVSDAKSTEIWSRIQMEMEANRIYRDPTVSRDMFAARVGCNHTWFSQVIKERTGMSYPQFMNARRVEEALEILSDPISDITHEELWRNLGFLSKATFYNSFKNQMGMSPAEYRRRALTDSI